MVLGLILDNEVLEDDMREEDITELMIGDDEDNEILDIIDHRLYFV